MYQKILLAVDGSENSIRATEEVIKICQESNHLVQLEVVNALQEVRNSEIVLQQVKPDDVHRDGELRIQPNEEKLRNASIPYTRTIERGDAGKMIANKANNDAFDLVVIGTRGLNGFQKLVVGSVSTEVIKRANCPVLVVK
ncbi:universal stress protein [Terribacillus sp. 179-K 1B1 HS]|uniref:universal stress protein n=1 Tax=Terribacillus sp. 179-K 1B1 HS TaxID=3142388 RepID=UPI0039A26776